MTTGPGWGEFGVQFTALDSGSASYERISWSDKGDALAVLKGTDDRAYRDKFYSVVGVTDLTAAVPRKETFDPAAAAAAAAAASAVNGGATTMSQ